MHFHLPSSSPSGSFAVTFFSLSLSFCICGHERRHGGRGSSTAWRDAGGCCSDTCCCAHCAGRTGRARGRSHTTRTRLRGRALAREERTGMRPLTPYAPNRTGCMYTCVCVCGIHDVGIGVEIPCRDTGEEKRRKRTNQRHSWLFVVSCVLSFIRFLVLYFFPSLFPLLSIGFGISVRDGKKQ